MALCFYGCLGFLHEHSWLWSSLLLSLQFVSSQPTTVPSLSLLSKPHNLDPAHNCTIRHTFQAGVCRAVTWAICVGLTLSCLPHTVCCILLQAPEAPFLFQTVSPPVRGLLWVQEPLLSFSFPPRVAGPILTFLFLFFSLLSLILPSCIGVCLVLLGVQGPLLVFSRFSVRIVPFVDVFLMYLWEEVNSTSSYSTILTSFPGALVLKSISSDMSIATSTFLSFLFV